MTRAYNYQTARKVADALTELLKTENAKTVYKLLLGEHPIPLEFHRETELYTNERGDFCWITGLGLINSMSPDWSIEALYTVKCHSNPEHREFEQTRKLFKTLNIDEPCPVCGGLVVEDKLTGFRVKRREK